jgi:hypothetical protein
MLSHSRSKGFDPPRRGFLQMPPDVPKALSRRPATMHGRRRPRPPPSLCRAVRPFHERYA